MLSAKDFDRLAWGFSAYLIRQYLVLILLGGLGVAAVALSLRLVPDGATFKSVVSLYTTLLLFGIVISGACGGYLCHQAVRVVPGPWISRTLLLPCEILFAASYLFFTVQADTLRAMILQLPWGRDQLPLAFLLITCLPLLSAVVYFVTHLILLRFVARFGRVMNQLPYAVAATKSLDRVIRFHASLFLLCIPSAAISLGVVLLDSTSRKMRPFLYGCMMFDVFLVFTACLSGLLVFHSAKSLIRGIREFERPMRFE